ncbi:hypothetical protein V8G54_008783 [Vigna mungo]|uniref:PB1-like domain-containing protein n=1 Tax=Vigna mungo TaxID=3915 RepID=A0AAQ3P3T6_VIGMU
MIEKRLRGMKEGIRGWNIGIFVAIASFDMKRELVRVYRQMVGAQLRASYFVVVSVVKRLGYDGFKDLWFSLGCSFVLDARLEPLCDDKGATYMVNLTRLNGQVHLYVVHSVSKAQAIHMIEYNVDERRDEVAPVMHEGGKGPLLHKAGEGIIDSERQGDCGGREKDDGEHVCGSETEGHGGVSEQLGENREKDDSEGLCGNETKEHGGVSEQLGEAREKHNGEGVCGIQFDGVCGNQSLGDDGVTQELSEGVGGTETKGYCLSEGERREVDDCEVEVYESEPTTFVEEACIFGDWSTSDDDNGEVNSMHGLVNINVDYDFREGDCSGNIHVQVESVSLENEKSDWSDISKSDLDDDDISDSNLSNDE